MATTATCYDFYVLLLLRPRSYIWPNTRACEYYAPDLFEGHRYACVYFIIIICFEFYFDDHIEYSIIIMVGISVWNDFFK